MLNTDNKTAAARRVGALCVVTMATAYVFRSPSACIADLWVTFSLTESFRSSLAFWALRCVTSSGLTCAHTHKHTRPVETCRLALSSGRPFSCEVAVYSSRTTALPATPFGASAVRARMCVHPCMTRRMCVSFFIVTDIKLSFLFPQNELYRLLTVRASELQNIDLPFLKGKSLIPAGRLGLKACLEVWRPIQTIQ